MLIASNYLWDIIETIFNNSKYDSITWVYLPFLFVMIDALLLSAGVIRVGRILHNERMVLVNFKFMAFHAIFVFVWGLSTVLAYLPYLKNTDGEKIWYWTIYSVIDFGVSCFIAVILWRVSGKKNEKLPVNNLLDSSDNTD